MDMKSSMYDSELRYCSLFSLWECKMFHVVTKSVLVQVNKLDSKMDQALILLNILIQQGEMRQRESQESPDAS